VRPVQAKKVAAAVAAVLQCAAEDEVAAALAAPSTLAKGAATALRPGAAWGLAGRQDAMLFRTMWQRRLAKS
jgi:hypothetical protein